MKSPVKEFFKRGMLFGGFGPIVTGIVYFCLSLSLENFTLSGGEVLVGIISTYLLAFVHAGASVFNQIEDWPITKSLFFHLLTLYAAYVLCYIANSWIPFEPVAILIFTGIFAAVYATVWLTVYITVRAVSRKMSDGINHPNA